MAHGLDFDTVAQCNTSAASGGLYQKAPLFVGAVTAPPYAATTCDANKAGMLQYTAATMQYCNGTSWTALGSGGSSLGSTVTATSPSRSGDATTGLFSATASSVSVATAGTERLTVTATGSVGVGTTTPAAKLDVNGAIKIADDASACTTANQGAIKWTGSQFQGCNGTSWAMLGSSATSCGSAAAGRFTNVSNQLGSTTITSNTLTTSGTDFTCIGTVTCTGCTDIIVNGVSAGLIAYIIKGDTVAMKLTSAAEGLATASATLTIGNTDFLPWTVTTEICAGTNIPPIGTICADDTVYAGLSPDGNVKMYTTRCDMGKTWDGSTCTGTASTIIWSSLSNWTYRTSSITGRSNTEYESNLGSAYQAARYCYTLSSNDHSDWYVPALDELSVLNTNRNIIGNFITSRYWSSTESTATNANYFSFGGGTGYIAKGNLYLVRCVRK